MRPFFILGVGALLACNADTFTGQDAAGDAGAGDVVSENAVGGGDGATEAGVVTPIDPNSLGNDLVLWLRAQDAVYDSGTHVVASWDDKSPHKQQISAKGNSPASCSVVGLTVHLNELNSYPAISFCDALVEASDDSSLQFGTNPFMIATVIEMGSPAVPDNYVLTAKSTSTTGLTGFALLDPNAQGDQVDAYLKVTDPHTTATISSAGQYHVVTMVRRKATQGSSITLRIDGVSQAPLYVPSEDVSESGAPFTVGGFDVGSAVAHVIPGKLAEILVVTDPTVLGDLVPAGVDLYLKQKYGL